MASIKIHVPDAAPQVQELTDDLVVGRTAPADLVIPDPKISRQHCRIAKTSTGWQVEDLGSSNGTHVAGRAIKAHPLRDGDKIEIGRTSLVFEATPQKRFAAPTRGSSARDRAARKKRR